MPSSFYILSPIHQANRQAALHIDALLDDLGISAQEGQMLAFVSARNTASVSAVTRLLGVAKSTMTSILARLERKKLLRRSGNPDDGRSYLLRTTARGAVLGSRARERVMDFEARVQALVSPADVLALQRIVRAVTRASGIDLKQENKHENQPEDTHIMDPNTIAFHFKIGQFVLHRNIEGIGNEESLRAPNPGGNNLNWVVGHIVRTRVQALQLLGASGALPADDLEAYAAGVVSTSPPLPINRLCELYDELQGNLEAALANATLAQLATKAPFSPSGNPDETIGTLLASIAFHEGYHLGQTGLLRRLLGKSGALSAPGEAGH